MASQIPFTRVAVLGTGLIGGSFGLALRRHVPDATLAGYDRAEVAARAVARGAVRQSAATIEEAVRGADLVYIAMPVGATIDALPEIAAAAEPHALVTDACSTKTLICSAVKKYFHGGARFLGGHPMAGKEISGIENADPGIFSGAPYALIGSEAESDSRVIGFAALVQVMGANAVWCDAEAHDWAVSITSHLPQLVSLALARVVQDETDETGMPLALAGKGLQDVLRLAGSSYSVWRDIFLTNRENIRHALDRLAQALDHLRANLSSRELEEEFRAANDLYAALRKTE
jgi:prephenate dehydrogenase